MKQINPQLLDLKERIHELKEYLYSETCVSCGETAIKLDKYIVELQNLMENLS